MKEAPVRRALPRRTVLAGALTLGLSAVAAEASLAPAPAAADTTGVLNGWRFCGGCFVLHRKDVWIDRSTCPRTGSSHQPAGWTFQLFYNSSYQDNGEADWGLGGWRNCYKCAMLYWAPGTSKICPAQGMHYWTASGVESRQFFVEHDIGSPPSSQNQWRHCYKCSAMFYNGYAYKGEYGLCAYDRVSGHSAADLTPDFCLSVSAYT
jgi:hypothetical protein